jgi:hypothetical protein
MWMRGKGLGTCARRLVEEIATIKSMDVPLPVRRGEELAQSRLRCVARPERRVAELLVRPGWTCPPAAGSSKTCPPLPREKM